MLVSQLCPTLRPHGLQPSRLLCSWGFPGQGYRSRWPFYSPGHRPDPGIEPGPPALQADSLPLSHREAQEAPPELPWRRQRPVFVCAAATPRSVGRGAQEERVCPRLAGWASAVGEARSRSGGVCLVCSPRPLGVGVAGALRGLLCEDACPIHAGPASRPAQGPAS